MRLTVVILAAPYASAGSTTALHYCRAALAAGHSIYRLFFYAEGVHSATQLAVPPQGEANLYSDWQALVTEHQLDAVVCIATALKRGLLDDTEADRYDKKASNLAPGFSLGGLGLLAEAAAVSDRLITFGG